MDDFQEQGSPKETDHFLLKDSPQSKALWRSTVVHMISWTIQTLLLAISITLFYQSRLSCSSKQVNCVEKHSIFSPALSIVNDDYSIWRFNGTFRKHSPYKGPPSYEVDREWSRISDVGAMSVSDETRKRIGAPANSIVLPEESGGGYMASIEVFHQIHCVNLLWQGTHSEYYRNRSLAFTDSPATLRAHLDHCADLLRQKLQCDGDVGVITYNWVKGLSRPYPNFNTQHKCRNFDDIWRWAVEQQIPSPNTTDGRIERLPGAEELELPP